MQARKSEKKKETKSWGVVSTMSRLFLQNYHYFRLAEFVWRILYYYYFFLYYYYYYFLQNYHYFRLAEFVWHILYYYCY